MGPIYRKSKINRPFLAATSKAPAQRAHRLTLSASMKQSIGPIELPSLQGSSQFLQETFMSLINTAIKPFTAQALKGGKFITISEADLIGNWSVVFFYPADFTFVCPTELEDLADNYGEFRKLGVEIYSVSTDTHFAHKAWHDTSDAVRKIEYTMVGDPTGTITRNFGVMIEEAGLADRGTFVIDPEGKIQIVEITAGGIGRDALELLRKVKAAQYVAAHPGEVCPAKWEEGEATLKPSLDLVGKI
jgi:peroxiredoxin (alkyl hydroperoxide reductase subunit C)